MIPKNALLIIMGLCLVAGLLVAGCTQQAAPAKIPATPTPVVTTTTPKAIGLANPASTNCGKIGATSVIMNNPDGSQYGMCNFPNGTSCEEWALFRGEGCKPNVAPIATPVK
jgi:putative hemolysin